MQEAQIQGTFQKSNRKISDRRAFTLLTIYGGIALSRRQAHRRKDESPDSQRDWYHPRLFVLLIGIMLMSIMDAVFTLKLIAGGAIEVNPIMNYFLGIGPSAFIIAKMILTGFSIIMMTALSNYLFLNRFLIGKLITISFIGYMVLICYELFLLNLKG